MRIKVSKLIAFLIIFVNVIALYFTWKLFSHIGVGSKKILFQEQYQTAIVNKAPSKHISKSITVVIRQFELYENDVSATVESILSLFPNIQIFIISDDIPYPPLNILYSNTTFSKNIHFFNLGVNLNVPLKDRLPLFMINTKYVLFIPDSTRISSKQIIQSLVNELIKNPNDLSVALYSNNKNFGCLKIDLNIREWTLKYSTIVNNNKEKSISCDAVTGKHATLIETQLLKRLTEPFMLPFPETLYVQTAVLNSKVHIINSYLWDGRSVLHSHHAQLRREQIELSRRKQAFAQLSIKKIIKENGVVDWYGCTRDTSRCFGTVFESVPSYLYKNLWTPPCCLAHLRRTARHVFSCLSEAGVRHWLEAGSLLGAMRGGDILPWDYDVDIGINRDDMHKVVWLSRASDRPTTDEQGFVWEKATEGQFFRVHYSKKNRIFVNLFPFYVKNGTMTRDGWFTSHKNMEFPDYFLHPISSIEFLGKTVPSPNNIRDFLELKFGKGAIENPQYPDPTRLKFPKKIYKTSVANIE
ncbi:fukutin-related protein [Chrysoperla carnea]|uniref:fukutin-related protein n=1 Tax=Chrysoperla carnea TaxID=189513 RepID=UPI001D09574C|nr:fukutin-related protein [Chrysoperla carnea]